MSPKRTIICGNQGTRTSCTNGEKSNLLEMDYITAVLVCRCLYVCTHAHKLLLKAPMHFHTLSIIFHFLLCVSILNDQINETPAMSLPLLLISPHHNCFSSSSQFFPKINLCPLWISFLPAQSLPPRWPLPFSLFTIQLIQPFCLLPHVWTNFGDATSLITSWITEL